MMKKIDVVVIAMIMTIEADIIKSLIWGFLSKIKRVLKLSKPVFLTAIMKKKDFIMASVLNKFEEKTKILASKVNQNFEMLQSDIRTLNEEIDSKLSSTKENILSDVQTVKESLESGKAENDLSNVESSILTNALMPDYSQPTTRILATEYIAETDLFLTCTDISAHDDYYYKLFLDYKDVKTEFHWGGYSDESDKQRDFIAINIPKNTKFKITGFNRDNKESNVPKGTIKTFPFIGITKDNSEVSE